MRVLLVEDDLTIAAFVRTGLTDNGFAVDCATDGEEALKMALSGPYRAAVIDIMLPSRDGLSIITEMRRHRVATPVIVLSARRSVDERVRGLQAGGDDYLVKPFALSELLARLHALTRRGTGVVEPTILVAGDMRMDLLKREVWRQDRKIDLPPREFALLEYLMRNPARVISKATIQEHVWGSDLEPQTNIVDVLVCRLRQRLQHAPAEKLIHTVRGAGYVLRAL